MAQVQDSGCPRLHPTRLRTAPPPACRPMLVFWWVLQSHRVIWLGCSLCPALPAPRRQLVYKRAASPALLTGGLESGGTMDVISVQQLVRTWEEGQEGRQSSGHPQISKTRRADSCFCDLRIRDLELKWAVPWLSAWFSCEVAGAGSGSKRGSVEGVGDGM